MNLRIAAPPTIFPFDLDDRSASEVIRFKRGLAANWLGNVYSFTAVAITDDTGTAPLRHYVRHSVKLDWSNACAEALDLARCLLAHALELEPVQHRLGSFPDDIPEIDECYAEFAETFLSRITHDEWEMSVATILAWGRAHATPTCRTHRLPATNGLCGICVAMRGESV